MSVWIGTGLHTLHFDCMWFSIVVSVTKRSFFDEKCMLIFEYKKKETELKALEAKLDKMLSDEKKIELELDEIAALLN